MSLLNLIGSIATILSILGAIINARGDKWGFYWWIVSNALWIFYAIGMHTWPQIPMYAVYIGICIYGIIEWKDKK